MIINAYIQNVDLQADGRSYVTEIQVDDVNGSMQFFYLCSIGDDPNAIMAERTLELNAQNDGG